MLCRELFEYARVGARARFGPLYDGQLELIKQNGRELLGRGDVERSAGQIVYRPLIRT